MKDCQGSIAVIIRQCCLVLAEAGGVSVSNCVVRLCLSMLIFTLYWLHHYPVMNPPSSYPIPQRRHSNTPQLWILLSAHAAHHCDPAAAALAVVPLATILRVQQTNLEKMDDQKL